MARSNTPCGLFVHYKNKALHRLTVPAFHDAGAGFRFCCFAQNLLGWCPEGGFAGLRLGRLSVCVLRLERRTRLFWLAGLWMLLARVVGLLLLLAHGGRGLASGLGRYRGTREQKQEKLHVC